MIFNKSIIKSNFNKSAKDYSKKADLQKLVANNLFNFAKAEIVKSQNIIDLGCGSGFILENILGNQEFQNKDIFQLDIALNMLFNNQNLESNIFNINADIENLPFLPNSFDLIISSLAFQWIGDLNLTLSKLRNTLRPNSTLVFSIFLDGTLSELSTSSKGSGVEVSINNFINLDDLKQYLSSNFTSYEIEVEDFMLQYSDVYELLKSIKDIGASYSSKNTSKPTLRKKDFEDLNNFYLKSSNINGRLEGSWRVAYIKAFS